MDIEKAVSKARLMRELRNSDYARMIAARAETSITYKTLFIKWIKNNGNVYLKTDEIEHIIITLNEG